MIAFETHPLTPIHKKQGCDQIDTGLIAMH